MKNTLKERHKSKIKNKSKKQMEQEIESSFEDEFSMQQESNLNSENMQKPKKVPVMSQKETRHAIRTRAIINRGFIELMQHKDFDDITIIDVCDQAMITRATFYKYYEDKYHLALCVINEGFEELVERAGYGDPTKSSREIYSSLFSLFLEFLDENRKKFQRFFDAKCNEKLRAMLLQKTTSLLEDVLKEEKKNLKLDVPIEIVSNFLVGGFAQILMYVFENDKTYGKEEVTAWVEEIADRFYIKEDEE